MRRETQMKNKKIAKSLNTQEQNPKNIDEIVTETT